MGIDYVQVPTISISRCRLLSVGGKTAVNLKLGKTSGVLSKQPILVLYDPTTLNTFATDMEWINGCGEIIKYGFLDVPGLLTQLERKPLIKHRDSVSTVIARCISKRKSGYRRTRRTRGLAFDALLNLGHTFGHGIRKRQVISRVHHGYAVAIGMVLMAQGAGSNMEN